MFMAACSLLLSVLLLLLLAVLVGLQVRFESGSDAVVDIVEDGVGRFVDIERGLMCWYGLSEMSEVRPKSRCVLIPM